MPRDGERYDDQAGHVMQWTGTVWAPVCPDDNVPMTGHHTTDGYLICHVCNRRATDLAR